MNYAPIAFFAYNRLGHTRQTVESSKQNGLSKYSDLFIFTDAAKSGAQADTLREVRMAIFRSHIARRVKLKPFQSRNI